MKCKKCKREIQKDFNLCPWCGLRLIPDATEIRVPEPKRKADGSYAHQVMYNGKRYNVVGATLEEYKANAREIKLGKIPESEQEAPFVRFADIVEAHLAKKQESIEESTAHYYNDILVNVLGDVGECDPEVIDWQVLVNMLSGQYSGGYIRGIWSLIKSALKDAGYPEPYVKLPKIGRSDRPFLDADEIPKLLDAIRGSKYEAGILLCLHSLRAGEVCALTAEDIYDGYIHVNKTMMITDNGYVLANRTKTETSTREVPVLIDRLYEVIPPAGRIVDYSPNSLSQAVKRACKIANITSCSAHDLRRSFASLCYSLGLKEKSIMKYGGWSNNRIMNDVYIKLSAKDALNDAEKLKNYFNFTAKEQKDQ